MGLFTRDFDDPASLGEVIELDDIGGPEAAPDMPPPAITQDMLDDACAGARAQGQAEGRAEAEAERNAVRLALMTVLRGQLHNADAQIRAAVDDAGQGLSQLVLAALSAGFPALCARHGAAELARFTRAVTDLLATEPRVVIRAHPSMLAALDEVLEGLEPEQRGTILVEAREALAPGDARIAWRHGLAVRDTAGLRARIEAVLAPLGFAPEIVPEAASVAALREAVAA